jgi:uncharacterized membrane protein YkgB
VPRFDDTAALASNWRSVLAADACLGVIALLVGLLVLLFINIWVGAAAGALSLAYLVLVAVRARKWKALRTEAGL